MLFGLTDDGSLEDPPLSRISRDKTWSSGLIVWTSDHQSDVV